MEEDKKFLEDKQFYEDEHNRLKDDSIREGDKLDKTIILLASGSLVLSATAVLNLAKDGYAIYLNTLWVSWMLLVASIVFILLAHFCVVKCVEKARKDLNECWTHGNLEEYKGSPFWKKILDVFNRLALISIMFGIFFLLWFGYINIKFLNSNNEEYVRRSNNIRDSDPPQEQIQKLIDLKQEKVQILYEIKNQAGTPQPPTPSTPPESGSN